MLPSLKSFRILAALVVAVLMVTGLQGSASAATTRSLSISASPAVSVAGTSVAFTGKITKSPKGTKVVIQRKSGSRWVTAATARTVNAAGNYAVRLVRPKTLGNYVYRATVAKTKKLKGATSRTVTVAALRRTLVSLSSNATTRTAVGGSITLSGTVLPAVKGTAVSLQRRTGSTWGTVASTTVLANGTFTRAVPVKNAVSTYRAVVARAGLNAPGTSNLRDLRARPLIETTALLSAPRLKAYGFQLVASEKAAGKWTASPLPAGLALNATGLIYGTPTTAGDTQVTIGFTQTSTGLAATPKTLVLRVRQAEPPKITTTSPLPDATRLTPYSTNALKVEGNPVGTWSTPLVGAGALPSGLDIDEDTGVISGTPTTVETKQVQVTFKQTNTQLSTTATLELEVKQAAAPVIETESLDDASVGVPYTFTLQAVGDPAGTWTASGRPAWLSLNATTGVLSGTPPVGSAGTDIVLQVGFTHGATGVPATPKSLVLRIDPGDNPVISTPSLPAGTRFVQYTAQLTAEGNPAGTWTASPLPAGLTLNATTGVISGTPTAAGTTEVTIGFTRTSNGLAATPKTLDLVINQAPAPVISTTSLPDATRFTAYTTQLTAAGDPAGTWTASPLPAGLTLNATTGVISGTPTAAGDTNVVVGFTQTATGLAATPKTLVLHVNQAAAPAISTPNLPDGVRTFAYTTQLTAAGDPAGTWTASPLPAGLELNPATGVISGTPTAVGTTQVTIGFTQTSTGLAAEPKTLPLTILQAPAPVVATAALPAATRLSAYTTTLVATTTGPPAGTWTASPLPAGLSLNATTGVISGTPTTVGTTQVTVSFTQTSTGLTSATKILPLVVNQAQPPVITTGSTLPKGAPALGYNVQLQVAGNPAGTWSVVTGCGAACGGFPPGISLKSNGQISGATLVPGNYRFTIKFTQTNTGLSSEKQFTLKIS